jgi:hypothetical protein
MGWAFYRAPDAFERYRERWDEINGMQGSHVLLDSNFVAPLVRHFASAETLLCICDDKKNPAMAIVHKARTGFWQTFQPSQGPLGLIVLGNTDGAVEQIYELMRTLPGYTVGFSVTQQDPDLTAFNHLNGSGTTEVVDYIKTPRITLRGTFDDYWRARGRDLAGNLNRRIKRLNEQGIPFELIAERDPEQIAAAVADYGCLEAMGWKGREHTAVTSDNEQGRFYREMLENFCRRREGVVYRLVLNGKTVASDLCIERNGILIVLKVAYDETVKSVSPSFLLRQQILKSIFSEGKIKVVEFYGRVRDWHLKWTDEVRTMFHVNFYRHAWVPVARRAWKACLRSR